MSRHAKTWSELASDLLQLIDSESPAHEADKLPMAITEEQSSVLNRNFTSRLAGYAQARRILMELGGATPPEKQQQPDFSKSPEELLIEMSGDLPPPMKPRE